MDHLSDALFGWSKLLSGHRDLNSSPNESNILPGATTNVECGGQLGVERRTVLLESYSECSLITQGMIRGRS